MGSCRSNAGIRRYQDRPITQQFTRAAPAVMGWPWRAAMFKTLFRNDGSYGKLGVHRPRKPDRSRRPRWFDGSGRELPPLYHHSRVFSPFGQDNYQLAQLNHYALQSMESYVVKCDRGRANRDTSPFDMSYWVERNFNSTDDDSIQALNPASAPLRADLLRDPVLGDLHRDAVAWRKRKFLDLMRQETYRALMGRLMLTPESQPLSGDSSDFILNFARQSLVEETKSRISDH